MEQQKKKRGENWSLEEKEILRHLIALSANILEDKSTKTNINIMKTKEWKNISIKFNEITGKCRSEAELKLAWKRMKLSAKANLSEHRREQTRTGGGVKPPSPSAEDLEIMAIAPHDFVIEVNNYDSDAVMPITIDTTPKEMCTDPIPGSSYEKGDDTIVPNDENVMDMQGTSNDPIIYADSAKTTPTIKKSDRESPEKRKKNSQTNKRNEEMRLSIVKSNTELKKRQLQMMEVEHQYNIKIAELKIKKMELEITILENEKNISTAE